MSSHGMDAEIQYTSGRSPTAMPTDRRSRKLPRSRRRLSCITASWGALALALLATVSGAPARAAGGDSLAGTAQGTFSQAGETIGVVDGFAYEAVGLLGDPVIRIDLVPAPLDRDALAAAIDFGVELYRQRATSGVRGSSALYLDPATGRWLGSSYVLPGGDSCGYCSVSAKQNLKVGNGRVRGKLRVRPEDNSEGDGLDARLILDLPIARVTGTEELPSDGGAPGEALRRCREAARADDLDVALPLCFPPGDAGVADTEFVVESARERTAFWGRRELLAEHLEIKGGRIKGGRAELFVETHDDGETQRGSIFLQHVDAGWRWIGQRLEPVYDDE